MNVFMGFSFLDKFQQVQDQTELFALLLLTLIAILIFKFLVATAETLVAAVAGMVRVLSGVVLPILAILLLLMFALNGN